MIIHIKYLFIYRYYNHLTLDAFKERFPPKAKVQVLTGKVSKEVLDSLIIADKYDVVLTARQINFEYHYDFTGINESGQKHDTGGGVTVGSTTYRTGGPPTPTRHAGTIRSSLTGPSFDFFSTDRRPPLIINAIIYHTDWDLQWITHVVRNRKNNIVSHLEQEDVIIDHNGLIDTVLISAVQQAGKCIGQVFAW